jgi:ribonuclease HI
VFTIWTDGCCLKNPGGAGGWAAIIEVPSGRHREELSGSEPSTTNNRMELTAAIEGLEFLAPGQEVLVISDSKYVVTGITQWCPKWRSQDWMRKERNGKRSPVLNVDLWQALLSAVERHKRVDFRWVRGHNGTELNERADELAGAAARALA